jgi:hypothetical protein
VEKNKNIEFKKARGRLLPERDEQKIDETPAEFLDESINSEGKWTRDKFGDEHYADTSIDQGKIQFGRKLGMRKNHLKK